MAKKKSGHKSGKNTSSLGFASIRSPSGGRREREVVTDGL